MVRSVNGSSVEVDGVSKTTWDGIIQAFDDVNIYQTWPYEVTRSGRANVSHLVIKRGCDLIAVAQARLVRIPFLNLGVAYIRWGPLWRRSNVPANEEVFREAVQALRNEYVTRRKLTLRIAFNLHDPPPRPFQGILEAEGFVSRSAIKPQRTIVMDIRPPIADLYKSLHQKWRYNLKKARTRTLEVVEGSDDNLFEDFEDIYAQMRKRKQLTGLSDPGLFRNTQRELAPVQKLRVILCRSDGAVCSGGICSALGDTGLYLLGATSDRGTKTYASYLVHWRMLEWVKAQGCHFYDLNGINPTSNPGGYQFKVQLGGNTGRDIHFLGAFDAYPNAASEIFVAAGDLLRGRLRHGRNRLPDVSR